MEAKNLLNSCHILEKACPLAPTQSQSVAWTVMDTEMSSIIWEEFWWEHMKGLRLLIDMVGTEIDPVFFPGLPSVIYHFSRGTDLMVLTWKRCGPVLPLPAPLNNHLKKLLRVIITNGHHCVVINIVKRNVLHFCSIQLLSRKGLSLRLLKMTQNH